MAEMLNNLQKRSVIELIDELNVAVQSLKIASSSETLVTLHKKLDVLGSLVAKAEHIIELSEKERSEVQVFISEFRQSMLEFREEMDKVDLSKLDQFCKVFKRFSDQLIKDISLYKEVADESSKEIENLRSSLGFTKWTSIIVGICLGLCGFLLYVGAILPLQKNQSEVTAAIGEESDRYIQLMDQRRADIETIKQKDDEILDLQTQNKKAIEFIRFLNHYDNDLILLKKKDFDALKR